jgi:hypothetical protein
MVHTTGWLKGLRVTADGTGIVLHAGVALIRVVQVAPDNRVVWFRAISASACTDTTGSLSTYTTRAPVPPAWGYKA